MSRGAPKDTIGMGRISNSIRLSPPACHTAHRNVHQLTSVKCFSIELARLIFHPGVDTHPGQSFRLAGLQWTRVRGKHTHTFIFLP